MAAAYYTAAEPKRRRILGQVLEPFTIGHAHLLAARGNPFCPITGVPAAQDLCSLIDAVFICAHDYAGAKRALRSPWLNWKLKKWGERCRGFDFLIERELFRRHLADVTTPPEVWSSAGRELGSPTLVLLWQHLRWTRDLSEAETMDYPFGKALWDYLAFHETRGNLQICNATEREMMERMRSLPTAPTAPAPETKSDDVEIPAGGPS